MTATEFRPVLVLPVYNHGRALADMFEALLGPGLPIIVVDDGSDSHTAEILSGLTARSAQLTVLSHPENLGKGGAVSTGIRYAAAGGYSHVLQIDADGQHDPSDIERFLKAARAAPASVVIGRPRFDSSIPASRRIGRYLTHLWIWIETLSLDISDSMCGFRVYPVEAVLPLLSVRLLGQRMDFDPEILVRLHWQGTPFQELSTRVVYPPDGRSNFRILEDNALITSMHTRLVLGMLWRLPGLLGKRLTRSETSARKHWAGISERGTLLGLRFMLTIYRIFGRWLFKPVAAVVVGYFALTSATARRASREYLDRVWSYSRGRCTLPGKPDYRTSFSHFLSFADAVLDKIAAWQGAIAYEQIDHENLALFESRQQSGEGAVWVTSHLGNIEVCRAIGQQELNFQLTVLMHTRHAENFNRLLREVAPDSNVELLEVSEFTVATALKLKERVSQGKFIIIVGDRTPVTERNRVVTCSFLGRPADFPLGPFLLATLLGCPAGTLFCVREGNRFRMFIDDLPGLAGVSRRERQAAVESAAQLFAARLEALCVRYPLQWFNFFPFWNDQDGMAR